MKRIIFSMLLLMLLLTGCVKVTPDVKETNVKVITPQGAPLLTQLSILEEDEKNSEINFALDVVNGPDPIKAAFTSSSHDIIVSPINLGVILNKKQEKFDYQLLSVISKGNIFLTSTSKIEHFTDLQNKKIVLFGENTINDYVVKEIFGYHGVNAQISYLGNTQLTSQNLIADKEKDAVYLVAEPVLTAATLKLKSQNKSVYKLDVTTEFKNISNIDFYQAAVYAKKDLNNEIKDKYLGLLENSIKQINESPNEFVSMAQKYKDKYNVLSEQVLKLSIKGSNYYFERNVRSNLNKLILKYPKAFGNSGVLDEKFFY